MNTVYPRRIDDVADLLESIDEERLRNPLVDAEPLSVVGGTEGDPFTIDGVHGTCLTSAELTSYVENAEEIRTELVEHHTGCVSVLQHVGEVDRERARARRSDEQWRREQLRTRRLEDEIARLRGAIARHREERGNPRRSDGGYAAFPCDERLWAHLTERP